MGDNTTCPPRLTPESQACDGGLCLSPTTCLCAVEWSGYSDFVRGSPSCWTYDPAARTLWAVSAAVKLISLIAVARILAAMRRSRKFRRRRLLMLVSLEGTAMLALGVWRAADLEGSPIGTSVGPTVLLAVGCLALFSFGLTYMQLSLATGAMVTRAVSSVARAPSARVRPAYMRCLFAASWAIAASGSAALLAMPAVDADGLMVLAAYYFLATACGIAAAGVGHHVEMRYLVRFLTQVCDLAPRALDEVRLQALRDFIDSLFLTDVVVGSGTLANVVLLGLVGAWPILHRLGVYVMPVVAILTSIIISAAVYVEFPELRRFSRQGAGHGATSREAGSSGGGGATTSSYGRSRGGLVTRLMRIADGTVTKTMVSLFGPSLSASAGLSDALAGPSPFASPLILGTPSAESGLGLPDPIVDMTDPRDIKRRSRRANQMPGHLLPIADTSSDEPTLVTASHASEGGEVSRHVWWVPAFLRPASPSRPSRPSRLSRPSPTEGASAANLSAASEVR